MRGGAVYVARGLSSGLVKIGFSRSAFWRARSLVTEAREAIEVIAAFPAVGAGMAHERALHHRFAALRVRGEWFRDDGAIGRFVSELPAHQRGSYIVRPSGSKHRGPSHPPAPAWLTNANRRAS